MFQASVHRQETLLVWGNGSRVHGPSGKTFGNESSIHLINALLQADGPPVADNRRVVPFVEQDGLTHSPLVRNPIRSSTNLEDDSQEVSHWVQLFPLPVRKLVWTRRRATRESPELSMDLCWLNGVLHDVCSLFREGGGGRKSGGSCSG